MDDHLISGQIQRKFGSAGKFKGHVFSGIFAYPARQFDSTDIVTLTEDNFQTEVLDDPGLIIIDFWAEWCQPCKMMAPVFAELNGEEDKVKFCKVNVDEQPNLASMFGIDSIPTLAVVQDRHTLTGMVGVHDKADIKAMLEKCKA